MLKPYAISLLESYNSVRRARAYRQLSKYQVNPFVSISPQGPLTYSEAKAKFRMKRLPVPNVSGFYHGLLKEWWEQYGLGDRCLLISETFAIRDVFKDLYPQTEFVTTDYYLDLQPHPQCDVVWDLCSPELPKEFEGGFSSVINQATMEHIMDPAQVMRNLSNVLRPGGLLYMQTHTPAFAYHGYPKDYLRYFPDWFQDIGGFLKTLSLVELLCLDGHAFAVYRRI